MKALIRHISRKINGKSTLLGFPGIPWPAMHALHLVAVVLCVRPGDADCEARPLVIQGEVQRRIVRVAAVREGGDEFRLAGADHDGCAVAPVDSAGERAPMGLAASLHR